MPTNTPTSHYGMSFVIPSWLLRSSRCSLLKSSCRPRLSQSSTFFTWLRMSYPSFRDDLLTARRTVKQRVLSWQREYVQAVRQGQEVEKKINPHLALYIHITNLHTLFEFCIPA